MKKLSYLALAAVGLLLGACSSDKDVEQTGNILQEQGVGYFKVSLNLPYTPSTRAWSEDGKTENDEGILSDGKNWEYAVDNVYLILFGGTNEADAEVVQVSPLATSTEGVDKTPDQVTVNHQEVITLSAAAVAAKNLFALVVINGTGIIEPSGTGIVINGTTSVTKLSELQAEVSKALKYGYGADANKFVNTEVKDGKTVYKNIFMTNAVLCDVKGGKNNPTANPSMHILAPVNKSYIYEKASEAETGVPAADIYVERGVAKVTLSTTTLAGSAISAKTGATVKPGFLGWCLDRTNARSFIVRKVPAYKADEFSWNYYNEKAAAANDVYRFVGNYPVDAEYGTTTSGYRTYWALDPNYDKDAGSDLLSPASFDTELDANKDKVGDDYPQYCYENTFNVDKQSYKNTTTAIIKIAFNDGKEFFTIGADRKTIYPQSEITTLIKNALMGISAFSTWITKPETGAKKTSIVDADLTVEWTTTGAGAISVKDITLGDNVFEGGKKLSSAASESWESWKTTINSEVKDVKRFLNGVSYYPIRIKHFGDDLTPWENIEVGGSKPKESSQALIYPGTGDVRNKAYLGRYGVVRNNWYDIKINDVLKIGYASPDELKNVEHPDDELEDNFIKARINILSWAKRTQAWKLK